MISSGGFALTKEELRTLAELGALNCFAEHRRAAMWRVEEQPPEPLIRSDCSRGRRPRNVRADVRLAAGVTRPRGYNITAAAHDDARTGESGLRRDEPHDRAASDEVAAGSNCRISGAPAISRQARHGATIQIAGNVICRQRPGTAKGFVFISLEDETGVSNAIVTPDLFERVRLLITEEPFLIIEGRCRTPRTWC